MRTKWIILLVLLNILTSCTSLNDKCHKLAEGTCWPDVNRCGIKKEANLEACKYSTWSCGYHFDFRDPQ
jgi:hypothetical protein